MGFNRVNVEITNICGLSCSFCPPKVQPSLSMSLYFFEEVLKQLQGHTKVLALHVMGDPLTLSNLEEYLDLAQKYNFSVELTTSGYYLNRTSFKTLFHKAVRQINISLNSYNKNSMKLSFDEYLESAFALCREKLKNHPTPFINLRLWNLDDAKSEDRYNSLLFERIGKFFEVDLLNQDKSIRLASKIILNFDTYFEWPSLNSTHNSQGSCYGLKSHIGILSDGRVVPCCLDGEGVINLGNLHERSLEEILNSERATSMRKAFSQGEAIEELCQKCSYKDRFNDIL